MGREPCRIGGEKSEWGVRVLAVLGKIEVNAANQVPCRIPPLQEILHTTFRFGQLDPERRIEFLPQSVEDCRRQIFRAGQRGRRERDFLELLHWRGREAELMLRG